MKDFFTNENNSFISTDVKVFTLENGMIVWLNEDHHQPKIFGAVVVKAGSKDSPNTGIAHYFEHIMFKGTENIGTVDYVAEKVFLDKIAEKYDLLASTKNELKRHEIQLEINELSLLAADYVIPNEFDKLISKYGGTNLNAGTSFDYTVYHNTFSPQYIEHWAELNSERLLCPVFRMFQSELETVYEEKNRRDDMMFNQAMEKAFELYFYPHPYAYPIIGSAENLKNPRLSEMRRFFRKYYVANNMGLILSGDFDAEKALRIISKAFSRIPCGEAPLRYTIALPPFKGREKYNVKIPIPLMRVMVMGFRGVPSNHPDQAALDIAVSILNNPSGTGYLDRLMVQRKLMGAIAGGEAFNEAGMLGFVIIPKLVIQSYAQAERLVWKEINKVRKGDFPQEMFESLKQEQLWKNITALEDIDSRSQVMIRLLTQGKTWDDYISELKRAGELTKDDVVRIANKYLNNNYIFIRKQTGKYMKEYLPKPNFTPVVPKHSNASSDYARRLETLPVQEVKPRFLDFENDVKTVILTEKTTLYVKKNPVNNIFTLKLSFGIGTLEKPEIRLLANYLPLLGTKKYSYNEFHVKLQIIGSLMLFDARNNRFVISVSGFDGHFEETLVLLGDFMNNVKNDGKKLKTLADDAKVGEKAFSKSSSEVAEALFEYVQYGSESQFLNKPSLQEINRYNGHELLNLFDDVQKISCDFHYCGSDTADFVEKKIKEHLPVEKITKNSRRIYYREPVIYDKPLVFFYDMSDISQNIVYSYQTGMPLLTFDERCTARLFSEYFGGGMSSLLFQEIREFRAYAYQTSGSVQLPPPQMSDKPFKFITFLSTQSDKTIDAMKVLHSLIRNIPVHREKIDAVIKSIINEINNEYPSFRNISVKIAQYKHYGYTDDSNKHLTGRIKNMTIDDVAKFHETYIRDRNIVYVIVGNSSKLNMSKLALFGNVIHLKKRDFYKQ
jgi:predicted Zn-dependent peptidase